MPTLSRNRLNAMHEAALLLLSRPVSGPAATARQTAAREAAAALLGGSVRQRRSAKVRGRRGARR